SVRVRCREGKIASVQGALTHLSSIATHTGTYPCACMWACRSRAARRASRMRPSGLSGLRARRVERRGAPALVGLGRRLTALLADQRFLAGIVDGVAYAVDVGSGLVVLELPGQLGIR